MSPRSISVLALAVAGLLPAAVHAAIHTGANSSQSPYLLPVGAGSSIDVWSILTTGDSVNTSAFTGTAYKFGGIPDGIGSLLNTDGSMRLLVNHEIPNGAGVGRASGTTGAYVGDWTITPTAASGFAVRHGQDLSSSYSLLTGTSRIQRFCSGDLAPVTAFYNPATGKGTTDRLFMNGEEVAGGRSFAHDVNTGVSYEIPALNGFNISQENSLAHPGTGDKTVMMVNSDGGNNRVYTYVGAKSATGSVLDKAGLTGGTVYGIQVKVNGNNVAAEGAGATVTGALPIGSALGGGATSGRFALVAGNNGTSFQRPEDGAWDPSRPNDYYFVTTDRLDTRDGGNGAAVNQAGVTRLWRMTYDDINNPTAGGSITAIFSGTGAGSYNMLDNITVVPGVDGHTRVIGCEDVGNASHNGKVWLFDADTGAADIILQHDAARFGDVGVLPSAPFTYDKESSGVVDARDTIGLGWFLIDVQDHQSITDPELVEGGQLMAFYAPQAIPEPSALTLLGVPILALARRTRRA